MLKNCVIHLKNKLTITMVTGYHLSLNICKNKKQDDQICAVMSFSNLYGRHVPLWFLTTSEHVSYGIVDEILGDLLSHMDQGINELLDNQWCNFAASCAAINNVPVVLSWI